MASVSEDGEGAEHADTAGDKATGSKSRALAVLCHLLSTHGLRQLLSDYLLEAPEAASREQLQELVIGMLEAQAELLNEDDLMSLDDATVRRLLADADGPVVVGGSKTDVAMALLERWADNELGQHSTVIQALTAAEELINLDSHVPCRSAPESIRMSA